MKKIKLTEEEREQMSYADVANRILMEYGDKIKIQDLFKQVIDVMELDQKLFESKIADFFGLISTDKRFIMLEDGYWDIRQNHTHKIKLDLDEEDEEEIVDEVIEEESDDEEDDSEVNYDNDSVDDDDEEDDLKDLVIIDGDEEDNMM